MRKIFIDGKDFEELVKSGEYKKIDGHYNYYFDNKLSKVVDAFEDSKKTLKTYIYGHEIIIKGDE